MGSLPQVSVLFIALQCFAADEALSQVAQGYLLSSQTGWSGREVNTEFMISEVSTCVAASESASVVLDCSGRFAEACMEEERDWGYTTFGMIMCIGAAATAWNLVVEELFPVALANLEAQDESERQGQPIRAEGRPYRAPSLVASHSAWMMYRDAECEAQFSLWRAGTGAPVLAARCHLEMNAQRAAALFSYAYENG